MVAGFSTQSNGHSNSTVKPGVCKPTDPKLEAWLNNDKAPVAKIATRQTSLETSSIQVTSVPAAVKTQTSAPPPPRQETRPNPSLEAWLNNEKASRPSVATREAHTSVETSSSQVTSVPVVEKVQSSASVPAPAPHEARKSPATSSGQAASAAVESHEKTTATAEKETDTKIEQHRAGASTIPVENRDSAMLIDFSESATPQQAPGNTAVQSKPSLFDLLLEHLNERNNLPSQKELAAMIQNSGAKPQPQSPLKQVKYALPVEDLELIDENEGPKTGCRCPPRAYPIRGLGASRHNVDSDGDSELVTFSVANTTRFAINVIIQDHPQKDCPILQKAMKDFPLEFGAVPATTNTGDDSYEVIPWASRHIANPKRDAYARGGLAASFWAD